MNTDAVVNDLAERYSLSSRKKELIKDIIYNLHRGMAFIKKCENPELYEQFWQLWLNDSIARAHKIRLSAEANARLVSVVKGMAKQHKRLFDIVHNKKRLGRKKVDTLRQELRKNNNKYRIVA